MAMAWRLRSAIRVLASIDFIESGEIIMNYHYPGLNSPGLQPGDNKTPKYNTAASTALLMAMSCLQRVIGGIAIGYRRLKPPAIEKSPALGIVAFTPNSLSLQTVLNVKPLTVSEYEKRHKKKYFYLYSYRESYRESL
jgi:hypothetical protein